MKNYENFVFSRLPEKYQEFIIRESVYAGYRANVEKFVFWLLAAYAFIIAATLAAMLVISPPLWISALMMFFLITTAVSAPYLVFSSSADSRKKEIDDVLPDFLLLVAANIRSGLTIDRAILFSARPEFGSLSVEFKKVAFEIYGGASLETAFSKLTKRIKSGILERTISLIVEGIKSGGAVAKLLEEIAIDIRNTETLQKEIRASVMMYVMFIFMAAVIGAPALFAISTFLIQGTMAMWGDMDMSTGPEMEGTGAISIAAPSLDGTVFGYFAIAVIIITTTFSGILISLIQSGNARQGLKYCPIFTSIALLVYFAAKEVLFRVFGSMLGLG